MLITVSLSGTSDSVGYLDCAETMSRQPIQKRREPAFIEPMQCKSVTVLPSGEKWTFEVKFDGYRCIAVKRAP